MMTLLELATFEEIFEELASRFDNAALIVNKPSTEKSDQQRSDFKGDPNILIGLLATLQYNILRSKESVTEDTDDV